MFHRNLIRTPNIRSAFCRVKRLVDALLSIDWITPGFQRYEWWMDDLIRRAFSYWAEGIDPPENLRLDMINHAETKPNEGKSYFNIFNQ